MGLPSKRDGVVAISWHGEFGSDMAQRDHSHGAVVGGLIGSRLTCEYQMPLDHRFGSQLNL